MSGSGVPTTASSAIPATASFLHRIASGDFANNSHPLHPFFAHFPLAFFVAAFASDTHMHLHSLSSAHEIFFKGSNLAIGPLSYWFHCLAVVAAVPAALTGLAEYFKIVGKRDTAFTHALLNVTALSISLYNITTRRGRPYFDPTTTTGMASMTGLVGALYSGYLGGKMVYQWGTAVKRQGAGASNPPGAGFVAQRGYDVGKEIVNAAKGQE